jgi:hypothetical protein
MQIKGGNKMQDDLNKNEDFKNEHKETEISYHPNKDFYRGMSGELRYKAEGLFKKAKEKGISIEEVDINVIRESQADFPGIGIIDLPAFVVKVRGRNIQTGQTIVDGKQMDYYNRYQMYLADKIEAKNQIRDDKGKVIRENNKPKIKSDYELSIDNWERFEIGKSLIEDKEFGLEKPITGGCDRIIRKLMGENDWLYQGEARLLDEEFEDVQNKIKNSKENKGSPLFVSPKKATERQVNYLKSRIKNLGLDPEDKKVIGDIIKYAGFEATDIFELNTVEMSKIIDNIGVWVAQLKENALINKKTDEIYKS